MSAGDKGEFPRRGGGVGKVLWELLAELKRGADRVLQPGRGQVGALP